MNKRMMPLSKYIVGSLLGLLLQGCFSSNGTSTLATNNPEEGPLPMFDANVYPLNKVVCDPFDPGNPGPNDGMIATLHYRTAGQPAWQRVNDYIDQGHKSSQYIFFSKLNVPTRIFSLGFPTETGESIKNDVQETLNEYFALSVSSILKLAAPDEEGEYELALLSDDGATFQIRQGDGSYRTVVDNDGNHPTRMGCGERITMTRASDVVVRINYYQGPRYHISVIPMWRKVNALTQSEPRCGHTGNGLFFDYKNNSQPQPAYQELLARGWKPISEDNWNMPAYALFNPCTQGTIPNITSYANIVNLEGTVVFNWNTDIPATSQVLYKNVRTGEELITDAPTRLRTAHSVAIQNLVMGETYEFSAVSISADYGKAISNPMRLQIF